MGDAGEGGGVDPRVRAPAVLMLVGGIAHLLAVLETILESGEDMGGAFLVGANLVQEADPDLAESLRNLGESTGAIGVADSLNTITYLAVTLCAIGAVLFGSWMMLRGQLWSMALVAATLTMISCCGPCCGVFTPVGIWAFVVLLKPEVRASFT